MPERKQQSSLGSRPFTLKKGSIARKPAPQNEGPDISGGGVAGMQGIGEPNVAAEKRPVVAPQTSGPTNMAP